VKQGLDTRVETVVTPALYSAAKSSGDSSTRAGAEPSGGPRLDAAMGGPGLDAAI